MIRFLIKPVNSFIAGYSFVKSSVTGKVSVRGMPVALSIELTNNCNLNCPECLSGSGMMSRGRGFMDLRLFQKILDEAGPYLLNMNLYFQGEPMMHPGFFSFLERAVDLNTTVATNGHFLTGGNAEKLTVSGLNRLIISLDGMDQASYSSYRKNGNFNLVMEGIRNVAEAKKRNFSSLKLIIQFLVNKNNEYQILSAKNFAREVNASLKFKSMQIISKEAYEEWLPSHWKFRRYELVKSRYIIKNPFPDRCARLWFNPVITWEGKVLPCCFDKDGEHVMGNLCDESFRDIWNGDNYRIFRQKVLTGRKYVEICRNCTSGLKGVKC